MGSSTVYDVVARMSVRDSGLRSGMNNISRASAEAAKTTGALGGALTRVGAIAAGVFTARAAYSSLIGYNQALEDTKNSLTTVINLNQGGTWDEALVKGTKLMNQFKEDAKTSAGTMKDMADFASMISSSVLGAGGSMEELRKFTSMSVVGAAAFGMSPEVAAMDMVQALRGTMSMKDKMTTNLVRPLGYDNESFNKLDEKKRFEVMKQAVMESKVLQDAAKAQGNSLSGVLSTTQDNIEQMLGSLGSGLFGALKGTFQELNGWIEKNQDSIKSFGAELGGVLKGAFSVVKEVMSFLLEHRELLMTLAKAWLASKAAKAIGTGLLVQGASGLNSLMMFEQNMAAAGGGMKGFTSSLGGAVMGLQALYVVSSTVARWIDEHHDTTLEDDAKRKDLMNQAAASAKYGGGSSLLFHSEMKRLGLIGADGRLDKTAVMQQGLAPMGAGGIETMQRNEVFRTLQAQLDKSTAVHTQRELVKGMATLRKSIDDAATKQWIWNGGQTALRKGMAELQKEMGPRIAQAMGPAMMNLLKGMPSVWAQFTDMAGMLGFGGLFGKNKATISVNKLVIDVKSDDPDRLVMGIEGYLNDYLRNGTPPSGLRAG